MHPRSLATTTTTSELSTPMSCVAFAAIPHCLHSLTNWFLPLLFTATGTPDTTPNSAPSALPSFSPSKSGAPSKSLAPSLVPSISDAPSKSLAPSLSAAPSSDVEGLDLTQLLDDTGG